MDAVFFIFGVFLPALVLLMYGGDEIAKWLERGKNEHRDTDSDSDLFVRGK